MLLNEIKLLTASSMVEDHEFNRFASSRHDNCPAGLGSAGRQSRIGCQQT